MLREKWVARRKDKVEPLTARDERRTTGGGLGELVEEAFFASEDHQGRGEQPQSEAQPFTGPSSKKKKRGVSRPREAPLSPLVTAWGRRRVDTATRHTFGT